MKKNSILKPVVITAVLMLVPAFVFDMSADGSAQVPFWVLVAVSSLCLWLFRKNTGIDAAAYTLIAGSFLKFLYVLSTPVWLRQHDVVDFGAGEGHAAYMEYILTNKSIPDFDPRKIWGFFQPPLHHAISAVWMWINLKMGLTADHVHKNVQILPLFYMIVLSILTLIICRELNMRKRATAIAMLITSFHPVFIMMSGSINNDALATMLTVAALYFAIIWYLEPTTVRILLLALSIGLAMAAKLSAFLITPAIGVMMLYKFYTDSGRLKNSEKRRAYILQFIPFALVVFPIGLWWPLRNSIRFGMPATYIPEVGEQIEKTDFVSRFLDLRTASPFLYMKTNGYAYDEYNFFLSTIKSSLFGEGDYANISSSVTASGWILLISASVMLVVCIASLVYICTSKEALRDMGIKLLLLLSVVSLVGGYIIFAIKGANLSAADPRYCAAVVTVFSLFAGMAYDRMEAEKKKAMGYMIAASAVLFACASAAFYILIGTLTT